MFITSDIRKHIQERIEDVKNSLANGAASSYHDYQYTIGYLRGLEDAMEMAVDIVSLNVKLENDED